MKNIAKLLTSMSLLFAIFFGSIPNVKACGPFSVDPVFSFTKHGYYPLEEFIGKEPGIVPTSYGRISLFPFYRQLTNKPLSESENEQVVKAIKKRIGIDELNAQETDLSEGGPAAQNFLREWQDARTKTLESKTEIERTKAVPEGYGYYDNCLPDAFKTATITLNTRIKQYGLNENIKDWVTGQDAVFSNCGGNEGKMPKPASASSPRWLQNDREYQTAAAYFYTDKYPEARAEFKKIAADSDSSWKNTAKFVAARTLIRESSFIDTDKDPDGSKARAKKELLEKAQTQLETILEEPSMREFHKSAARLIGLVKFRKDGAARREELAGVLANSGNNLNISNDLTDYIWLLDKPERKAYDIGYEIDSKAAAAKGVEYYDYELKIRDLPVETRTSDLSDWLYTYQAADGFEHALEKWQDAGESHWYVAAISKATAAARGLDDLLGSASNIKRGSPAFATVRYHQIRLLLEMGKREEVDSLIRDVFSEGFSRFPISTQNRFRAQRMVLAKNLDEFLEFAQRKAAIFSWSDDGNEAGDELQKDNEIYAWRNRAMFDYDSASFFNHKMSLETLAAAAVNPKLPKHLRRFVITAAWTRAFLLKDSRIEAQMRPLMSKAAPKPVGLFNGYKRARSKAEREANGLLFVLSNPVLQPYVPPGTGRSESGPQSIDSFRGNWWCTDQFNPYEKLETKHLVPHFLSDGQNLAATKQEAALKALGNSATNLARRTIEFAKANARHRLTPQLLHLSVRSTRFGCGDTNTETFSKEAFDILRVKYPRSRWTKKTPYWFKGNGAE